MKIAVYALTLSRHIKGFSSERIKSIARIKTKYNLDIKLFIDQDESLQQECLDLIRGDVEVIDIRENLTNNLKKIPHINAVVEGKRNIGYKGMCLFNFSEYIHYLEGYDYAIRLDGDSIIHSDLFLDDFIDGDNIYGYVKDQFDGHKDTKETLPLAIKKYIDNNDIKIYCDREKINQNE